MYHILILTRVVILVHDFYRSCVMKKKLLFALLNVFLACSSFAYEKGETDLSPYPYLEQFRKSTYGVKTEDGNCTGIAISSTKIITAAHCIMKEPKSPMVKQITFFDADGNNLKVFSSQDLEFAKYSDWGGKGIGYYDSVLITIPYEQKFQFKKFVDINHIYHSNYQLDGITTYDEKEEQFIFDKLKEQVVFSFGFGSKNSFNFATTKINRNMGIDLDHQISLLSETVIAESGDSGGPIILCSNTDCKLLGVLSSSFEEASWYTPAPYFGIK